MKSTEFLIENDMEKAKQFALKVKQECQPYLQQVNDPFENGIYRGLQTIAEFVHKEVRLNNRQPLSTSTFLHKLLNEYFNKEFGHPYRNALFGSGNQIQVEDYGDPFIIFPVGKFEFLWSPTVHDLFQSFEDFEMLANEEEPYENDEDLDYDFLSYLIREANYQTTNLNKAIKSNNEIMIWCKEYYGFNAELDSSIINEMKQIILSKT